MKQTLELGDPFERTRAKWLREHLPQYEEVWSRFVGNDGESHSLPMNGLDTKAERDRSILCQSHYSMALYAYLLFQATHRAETALKESIDNGTSATCDSYLRDTENITLFLALLGQVCDMIEDISGALGDNAINAKVADYAKERNRAIHAARVPMSKNYVGIQVAKIARRPNDAGFNEDTLWDAVAVTDFRYLKDWFRAKREGLFDVLRKPVYPMIVKAALKRFGGREVDSTPPFAASSMLTQRPSTSRIPHIPPPSGSGPVVSGSA